MEIIKGKIKAPQKIVIYGPEGIGKSTFASQLPAPLFIDTEGSTVRLDVDRLPAPTSWEMLLQEIAYAKSQAGTYQTLVIDTMDWAEQICKRHICDANQTKSIEAFGYGKGYTYLAEDMGRLLNRLDDVRNAGMNVCLTAHAMMRKFEQPDEMGAYDRWELKLEKKTAPLVKEWAGLILFANYRTTILTDSQTKKKKAAGGERVMYTTHHPAWDAKNREGLPDELPFSAASIAHIFTHQPSSAPAPISAPPPAPVPPPVQTAPEPQPETPQATPMPPEAPMPTEPPATPDDGLDGFYQPLVDLMREAGFTANDLRRACGPKGGGGEGYFPADMEITAYPSGFPEHITANWEHFSEVMSNNKLPFDL